eukprot:jgi/Ulvmu1/7459/UM037_0002.1
MVTLRLHALRLSSSLTSRRPVVRTRARCTDSLPQVDLASCLLDSSDHVKTKIGREILHALREYSCVIVRDPRVPASQNDVFLDTMEDYFSQPREVKMLDARPDLAYQIGVTPDGCEVPRCVSDEDLWQRTASYAPGNEAHKPTGADIKWRYFWRLRSMNSSAAAPDQVMPQNFPQWPLVMDAWGNSLLRTAESISALLAVAYDLPEDTFTSRMTDGDHLLAPTGSDLGKHRELGTVYAGYHHDLNWLTAHGKSRYPGLHIWLRDGQRMRVKVPEGCLLLQAGRQMAYLTGGDIVEGMHEVVCTEDTLRAIEQRESTGRPLWRVSSTVFSHLAPNVMLTPLCGCTDNAAEYTPMQVSDYVASELRQIALAKAAA